jgi:dienelactone hydrolase
VDNEQLNIRVFAEMNTSLDNLLIQDFYPQASNRKVPATLWKPKENKGQLPVILVGHGGSGHRKSQLVLDIVHAVVMKLQIAVVAIDGPVHGERRSIFMDGPEVREEFRNIWATGASVDPMVEDWQSCIDYLQQFSELDLQRIGWYGISMGTAYGIPLIAAESRIKIAALGMWGTSRPPTERLIADAKKITVPVLFQVKEADEIFSQLGQQDLFDKIGSFKKIYKTYPGGHTDPKDQQLVDIIQFISQDLLIHK